MAIRNISLGGATDWSDNEILYALDLNDTVDAGATHIKTLSSFDRNSYLYDAFDDFESYSVGAFTSNAKWTVSVSGGAVVIASSTYAGGSGKEIQISSSNSTGCNVSITSIGLSSNKHKSVKMYATSGRGGGSDANASVVLTFGGVDYTIAHWDGPDNVAANAYCGVNIWALGSDQYDICIGNSRIATAVTAVSPEIKIALIRSVINNSDGVSLYIDDVFESKTTIQ